MSKLLEVNKLCASYGATQVLYDVDFTLEAGHITAAWAMTMGTKTSAIMRKTMAPASESARAESAPD